MNRISKGIVAASLAGLLACEVHVGDQPGAPASDGFAARLAADCSSPATLDACERLEGDIIGKGIVCRQNGGNCGALRAELSSVRAALAPMKAAAAEKAPATPQEADALMTASSPTPVATGDAADTGSVPGAPTHDQVQAAVTSATPGALAACNLAGAPVLIEVSIEIRTSGEVAVVTLPDSLRYGGGGFMEYGTSVPAVASRAVRDCLEPAYRKLKFPSYVLPPSSPTGRGAAYRCPPGLVAQFDPKKYCTPLVSDSQSYGAFVMLDPTGSTSNPTADEATRFSTATAAAAKAAACATTLASGFPPGTYAGEASQKLTLRDGSKVFEWKALTLKVDAMGCATWVGYEHGDIWSPGDEVRNIEKVNTTCVNEGTATIAVTSPGTFQLAASVTSKASGGTPIKYHLWECGHRTVQTDLSVDLSHDCRLVGSDSDAQLDKGGAVACQLGRPFDELSNRTITLQKDGTLRVPLTIADPGTLVLRRVDERR